MGRKDCAFHCAMVSSMIACFSPGGGANATRSTVFTERSVPNQTVSASSNLQVWRMLRIGVREEGSAPSSNHLSELFGLKSKASLKPRHLVLKEGINQEPLANHLRPPPVFFLLSCFPDSNSSSFRLSASVVRIIPKGGIT